MYKFITYPLGITVIAILSMITAIFLIAAILGYLVYFEEMWPQFCAKIYFDLSQPNQIADKVATCLEFQPVTIKICIAAIIYLSLFVVCSSILIWGGKKRKKGLMYPYLVTVIVITILTVALCSYVARYSPFEIKALMGFCCTFLSIITLACCFAVCRHIHQITMAEMITFASENKLDDSFNSRSGLRSVTAKGNRPGKLTSNKLASIKEHTEIEAKNTNVRSQLDEKKILSDSLFIVEKSIQTVSNHSTQNGSNLAERGGPQAYSISNTKLDLPPIRRTEIASRLNQGSGKQHKQKRDLIGKPTLSASSDVRQFRSLRKKKNANSSHLNAKRRTASATLIQSLVFKQNT